MSLKAGRLRHRIEIQEPVSVQDETTGRPTITWVTFARPWAEVKPISARELIAAGAQHSEVRSKILIRYRPGLSAKMRILHKGLIHAIIGVLTDPDSGQEWVTLPVGQGVAEV